MKILHVADNSPAAVKFLEYARTLPFVKEEDDKRTPPCQYTVEELKERLAQSEADISAGRTLTTAEVFKPYEKWL